MKIENTKTVQKRIKWIDIAKVIGIYLVVLGHLPVSNKIYTLIYSFHMPLFFFLSGLLFKTGDDKYLIKYIKKLLIGYSIYTLLTFIYYFSISTVGYNLYRVENVVWWKRITGALYGVASNIDYLRMLNTPLWYLLAAVCVVLLCNFICKFKTIHYQLILVALLAFTGLLLSKYSEFRLPWSMDVAFMVLPFFYAGTLCKQHKIDISKLNILLFFFLLLLFVDLSLFNGRVVLAHKQYGNNYTLMYLVGFLGVMLTIKFASIIENYINNRVYSLVKSISDNTLMILGLHYIQFWIIAEYVNKWGGVNIFQTNTKWAVLISLVAMVLNVGLIYAIEYGKRFINV